jgi:membrane protease YdiL (CAAX protease family)
MERAIYAERWAGFTTRLVAPWWHLPLALLLLYGIITAKHVLYIIPGYTDWLVSDPKLSGMITSLCVQVVEVFIISIGLLLYKTHFSSFIGVRQLPIKEFIKQAGITLAAWFVMALLYVGAYQLVSVFTPADPNAAMKSAFTAPSTVLIILNILGFIPIAFCEEFGYRGYVQKQMIGLFNNVPVAILVQGIFFGLCHGYQGPVFMGLNAFAGVMYGILAYNRKSLVPGMVVHFLNNTMSLIGMTYGT